MNLQCLEFDSFYFTYLSVSCHAVPPPLLKEAEMQEAAAKLEFEKAAHLRDQMKQLKERAGMGEKGK